MAPAHWQVGDLAKQAGISVRTLHHYDEIGLLSPAHRSPAGYRLYSPEDIARLQQIRSLRELGFSLAEIHYLIDRPNVSPLRVIDLHLRRLREQIELQQQLCRRLEAMAARLAAAEEVSTVEFLASLELMNMIEKVKTYYTPEQLTALAQRREELGEERIHAAETEWPELIAQVRAEMERGTDPADERVQALARRWRELVEAFTGGDPGIGQALGTMYQNEPAMRERSGVDLEVFAYIRQALDRLGSS